MGVCGCGKSLLGEMFARSNGGIFEDADSFHPPANVAKMSAGIPLTDEDRAPWFAILRARILEMRVQTACYVLACSALKQSYRDTLRGEDECDPVAFIYLEGSIELIRTRMAARKGHYMPPSLVDSQFAILEPPQDAIIVSIDQSPEAILNEIQQALRGRFG
jgi:carbohydrate kinase (thermoresistant glucokinase family)